MQNNSSSFRSLGLEVTKRFGLNECLPCAQELKARLSAVGKKGRILKLATKGGRGFIVMKDSSFALPFQTSGDEAISTTGLHFGVQIGDFVFDNVHREGIEFNRWSDSFDCDVHRFEIIEIEVF